MALPVAVFSRLLFLISLLSPLALSAGPYTHAISLYAGLEHDSNPNLTDTNIQSVSLLKLTPGYQMAFERGPISWTFDASANIERSSDQSQRINRQDPSLGFIWNRAYLRGTYSLDLSYEQSSTRAAELDENGFSRTTEGSIQKYRIGTDWTHQLTERTDLNIGAAHSQTDIDTGSGSAHSTNDMEVSLNHQWTERSTLIGRFTASESIPDASTSPSTTAFTPSLGVEYDVSELWRLDAHLGSTTTLSAGNRSSGWDGGLTLAYTGERLSGSAEYSRSTSASAFGGFNQTDVYSSSIAYEYDAYTSMGLDMTVSQQTTVNAPTTSDALLWANRELAEDLSMRFSYQHKETTSNLRNAQGNIWQVSLNYAIPEL
jgi:hypothetical protein